MSSAPSAPQYSPVNYVSPGANPYGSLPSPQSVIPAAQTPQQIGQSAQSFESTLPQWLQLTNYNGNGNPTSPGGQGGPFDQNLMNQAQQYYMQSVINPQVAQIQANAQGAGQNYGSYGAAEAGQALSQGSLDAFQAALGANQQEYQDVLGGRESYLSGGPAVAQQQNQLGVEQGQDVYSDLLNQAQGTAGYQLGSADMANNFNLNPAQNPNAFNLANYKNRFQQNAYNNSLVGSAISGPFGIAGSLLSSGLLDGLGGSFGGGGSGGLPGIGGGDSGGIDVDSGTTIHGLIDDVGF